MRRFLACLLALMLMSGPALAELVLDGSVVSGGS